MAETTRLQHPAQNNDAAKHTQNDDPPASSSDDASTSAGSHKAPQRDLTPDPLSEKVSADDKQTNSQAADASAKEKDDAASTSSTSAAALAEAYQYNPGHRGFESRNLRNHWYQLWRYRDPPPPPPMSMDDAPILPLAGAGVFSQATWMWVNPIMTLGYRRPLEMTDLWAMDEPRRAEVLSGRLNEDWERRVKEARAVNERIVKGQINPSVVKRTKWVLESGWEAAARKKGRLSLSQKEEAWRAPPAATVSTAPGAPAPPPSRSGHVQPSLKMALHDQMAFELWFSMCFKIMGDVTSLCSTLVLKQIIIFGQEAHAAQNNPNNPAYQYPSLGRGIGLAFGLFLMQMFSSLCQHQCFFRSMSVGVFSRAALISAIFRRALRLAPKDRPAGKLTVNVSADVSRIDFASAWFTLMFASPITMILCLILLILQIGPSAIAGYAILLLASPLQSIAMKSMFRIRRQSMQWTTKRGTLMQEILAGMRIVKSFAQESRFAARLHSIRKRELKGIRALLLIRALNLAAAFSLPVLAAVVSFIVYKVTGHDLDPARVFTALTLFQLLRLPLMFLPMSFSATTDAWTAFERLNSIFTADLMDDTSERLDSSEAKLGLLLEGASFTWETVEEQTDGDHGEKKKGGGKRAARKEAKKKVAAAAAAGDATPSSHKNAAVDAEKELEIERTAEQVEQTDPATVTSAAVGPQLADVQRDNNDTGTNGNEEPFALLDLNLSVPAGELWAITGAVGSGKSSLLQGCIGEMRKTSGRVVWGGKRVGFCAQSAWIQNATVRENITFGQEWDEERFWECVRLAELESDLLILPQGDETEIGEKGVTLSGGQKQRVNIARALYYDPDIYCLDDPLSALDAHVGKSLFNNAIMGLRKRGKTVLLVTHALHFLPHVDRIVTMEDGRIVESGSYDELVARAGAFSRLVDEFGGEEQKNADEEEAPLLSAKQMDAAQDARDEKRKGMHGVHQSTTEVEERNTGVVAGRVYWQYFKFGGGAYMLPAVVLSLVLLQVTQILSSYWLIWWQDETFGPGRDGLYIGVYAALGVATAISTFLMGASTGWLAYGACKGLHRAAVDRLFRAPMWWFDITPLGRITNRMSKDVDVVDSNLPDAIRMAANTLATVMGSVILISILTHYFEIAIIAVAVFYVYGAIFYRSSAREVKRLDALLRSALYAHFSETLSGLPTIRAYGEIERFRVENMKRMDVENRAYFLSIVNQRWLGIRLDFLGSLLVLVVGLLATAGAGAISGGQVGIALSYVVSSAQAFSWMTRQIAEVENDMNSAERLLHYADELEQEAPHEIPEQAVPPQWPSKGAISIKDLELRYRPGLPTVLSGITMDIQAGEKVAIVGRTGAGKSSLLTALLRLTEPSAGSVSIDGIDVSTIGLRDLRSALAVLPQDPLLFSGTLRTNLDPFDQYDDVRLNDALQRSHLVSSSGPSGAATGVATPLVADPDTEVDTTRHVKHRLTLDSIVEPEGSNLSLGQRSLVSLARALVKDARIVLLDEASASVDLETDAKVQHTLAVEFADRTLLTIAHRLRTILRYDRVAVFEQGRVVEFDEPVKLFEKEDGVFRSMCEQSNISRADIVRARSEGA